MFDPTVLDQLADNADPDSIRRLADLLWDSDVTLAAAAAWRLASLTARESVRTVLAKIPVSRESSSAAEFAWLPWPFADGPFADADGLIARIAQLLATANEQSIPPKQLALDPRIVIPLCAVTLNSEIRAVTFRRLWRAHSNMTLTPAPYDDEGWSGIIEASLAEAHASRRLCFLLGGLEMRHRVSLAIEISEGRPMDTSDWLDLFQPVMSRPALSRGFAGFFSIAAAFIALLAYFGDDPLWLVAALVAAAGAGLFAYRKAARYHRVCSNPLEPLQPAWGGSPRPFEVSLPVGDEAWKRIGCLGLIGAVAVSAAAWPVGLYAVVAGAAWFFFARSENQWLKPLGGLASRLVVAFGILSAVLIGLNLSPNPAADRVSRAERFILDLNTTLPAFLRPSLAVWLAILTVLTVVSIVQPKLRAATFTLQWRKRVGSGLAVIGALASFTFFTDQQIFAPRLDPARRQVAIVYRDAEQKETLSRNRQLAFKMVQQAVRNLSPSASQQYRTLFETARPFKALDSTTRAKYTAETADHLARSHAALAGLDLNVDSLADHGRPAVEVVATPAAAERKAAVADQAERAATQAEAAVKEAVSSVFSGADDQVLDFAFEYFKDYARILEPVLKIIIKPYAGGAVEELEKTWVDRTSDFLNRGVTRVTDRARAALDRISRPGHPPTGAETLVAAMETGRPDMVQAAIEDLRASPTPVEEHTGAPGAESYKPAAASQTAIKGRLLEICGTR